MLALSFGAFRFVPEERALYEGEQPLRLGSRALDILHALTEKAGELVTKEELVARAWPNTFVEDANLRVHIAALRKALGEHRSGARYILNVPGRGYCFVVPVRRIEEPPPSSTGSGPTLEAKHNLPARITRPIGREDAVSSITRGLPEHRFVTVVGPGGIGKTTVALEVSEQAVAAYADGVRFVDLAPLAEGRQAPKLLAFVLGLATPIEDLTPALIDFLRSRHMLLVFDSCEHIVEEIAELVEELLKGAPNLHVLATSREPLRAEGEHVHRLSPLAFPSGPAALSSEEALGYAAIRLFVERAKARLDGFELIDAEAPAVADICRRLDGIALAIELAAGRIDAFGVRGLAAHLDDRFRLLMGGRRTALPRHQTLKATLDWSFELLPDDERVILRRLAVFAGAFTLDAASAVASGDEAAPYDVLGGVISLVAKSLVVAELGDAFESYRLLESTRAYALEKLAEAGERERIAQCHAAYYVGLFERIQSGAGVDPITESLPEFTHQIDNVRAALEWAFSPGGEIGLGINLTAATAPLFIQLSMINESLAHTERAISRLECADTFDQRHRLKLYATLGAALLHTKGPGPQMDAAWSNALDIAERLGDVDQQMGALWGRWLVRYTEGDFRGAIQFARRFREVASRSAHHDLPIGDRLLGTVLHALGDQARARTHIERMLERYVPANSKSQLRRYQFDPRVAARGTHAHILWLQGFPDQAASVSRANVEEARKTEHAATLFYALAFGACSVSLLVGDLAQAERHVDMLLELSTRHGPWRHWGRAFEGVLRIRRGEHCAGAHLVRLALDALPRAAFNLQFSPFMGALAEAQGQAGDAATGLVTIDEALERATKNEEGWYLAELLRVKAQLLRRAGRSNAAARRHFAQSLDRARRQGALSWELRSATSLVLAAAHGADRGALLQQLATIYGRFTEGFETADLKAARDLILAA